MSKVKRGEERCRSGGEVTAYITCHTGRVRENNEDNFVLNGISKKLEYSNVSFKRSISQPLVAGVFDGMGGEANGEYASRIAAETAKDLYRKLISLPGCDCEALANNFATEANNRIRDFMSDRHCSAGGSTVAAVMIKRGVIYPFSLGDSRVYLLRGGSLVQLSHDHTLAQRKVDDNIYTREEALRSSDSHKLTLFLGADYVKDGLEAQCYESVCLQKGDTLLLCSDGLYDELTDAEIESVLRQSSGNLSFELVKKALQNGGGDNVTCVVIK